MDNRVKESLSQAPASLPPLPPLSVVVEFRLAVDSADNLEWDLDRIAVAVEVAQRTVTKARERKVDNARMVAAVSQALEVVGRILTAP